MVLVRQQRFLQHFMYRKGIDPFEVYMNMPGDVREEQVRPEVQFPVA